MSIFDSYGKRHATHILHEHSCFSCVTAGFQLANAMYSRLMFQVRDDNMSAEEVMSEHLDFSSRVMAAMVKRDKEAVARLILELMTDEMMDKAVDEIPEEKLREFIDKIREPK